jgi:hypothetical protein
MKTKMIKAADLQVGEIIAWKDGRWEITSIGTFTDPQLTDEYILISLENNETFVQLPWKRIHVYLSWSTIKY